MLSVVRKSEQNYKRVCGLNSRGAHMPIPMFRGKTNPIGVRMTPAMKKAAMAKARLCGDGFLTANTFGGLVRLLFWRYLDCNGKYLR